MLASQDDYPSTASAKKIMVLLLKIQHLVLFFFLVFFHFAYFSFLPAECKHITQTGTKQIYLFIDQNEAMLSYKKISGMSRNYHLFRMLLSIFFSVIFGFFFASFQYIPAEWKGLKEADLIIQPTIDVVHKASYLTYIQGLQ